MCLLIKNGEVLIISLPLGATTPASLTLQKNVARWPHADNEAIGSGIHVTQSFWRKLSFSSMEEIKFEKIASTTLNSVLLSHMFTIVSNRNAIIEG